jgi:hypothetical protein
MVQWWIIRWKLVWRLVQWRLLIGWWIFERWR